MQQLDIHQEYLFELLWTWLYVVFWLLVTDVGWCGLCNSYVINLWTNIEYFSIGVLNIHISISATSRCPSLPQSTPVSVISSGVATLVDAFAFGINLISLSYGLCLHKLHKWYLQFIDHCTFLTVTVPVYIYIRFFIWSGHLSGCICNQLFLGIT